MDTFRACGRYNLAYNACYYIPGVRGIATNSLKWQLKQMQAVIPFLLSASS
jgi:hypothetical protein